MGVQVNESLQWFVARTRHGREIGVRDSLAALGVEHFVPTGTRRASRGKRQVEIPLMNCLVFLKATRAEALDLIHNQGVKADYLFDCATRRMMVVPDKQMDDFRRVFEVADEITSEPLALGDRVVVTRGPLKGVEGYVLEFRGKYYVTVGLLHALFARAQVPRSWLQRCDGAVSGIPI